MIKMDRKDIQPSLSMRLFPELTNRKINSTTVLLEMIEHGAEIKEQLWAEMLGYDKWQ